MMNVPFNKPLLTGKEFDTLNSLILSENKFSGDGTYTHKCHSFLEKFTLAPKALLTTSCTHAMEMAALLIDIKPNDEIIMPSYTFVSTANPFVLRKARIKFVDIDPITMNIDPNLIEQAITSRTKAIVPVHYGGIACEMKSIKEIADKYNIFLIEDAAQAIGASYHNQHLGTFGHLSAISFHDTKNIHCGEGGALLINDDRFFTTAEILREKGTNRQQFLRGEVDKYTWVSKGSSYLPSELNAAFLTTQLEYVKEVSKKRLEICDKYYESLLPLQKQGKVEIMSKINGPIQGNGHLFFVKLNDIEQRQDLINFLKSRSIQAVFHYVPLHSSKGGKKYGDFVGKDIYTTRESEKLLRLPMFYSLENEKIDLVIESIFDFFA